MEEIRDLIVQGLITIDHHFWKPGFPGWLTLKDYENFRAVQPKVDMGLSDDKFSDFINFETRSNYRLPSVDWIKATPKVEVEDHLSQLDKAFEATKEFVDDTLNWINQTVWTRAMTAAGILAVVAAFWALAPKYSVNERAAMESLDRVALSKIERVIGTSIEHGVQATVAFAQASTREPTPVIGINLRDGATVELKIRSLLGEMVEGVRYQKKQRVELKERVTSLAPLRRDDGTYIPVGSYIVTATCIDCMGTDKGKLLFQNKILLGSVNSMSLSQKISKNNVKLTNQLREEVGELREILQALSNQARMVSDEFTIYRRRGSQKRWDRFYSSWIEMQKSIAETFQPLSTDGFADTLVLSATYNQAKDLEQKVSQLGEVKSEVVRKRTAWTKQRQGIIKTYSLIKQEISARRSQLNGYEKAINKGLPLSEVLAVGKEKR